MSSRPRDNRSIAEPSIRVTLNTMTLAEPESRSGDASPSHGGPVTVVTVTVRVSGAGRRRHHMRRRHESSVIPDSNTGTGTDDAESCST